ncbi:MAG: hypothetical protein AAB214_16205 [Fibrobacterota bacterium]
MSDSIVLIHLAFSNDGSVIRISETPPGVSCQAWFDHLSRQAGDFYQTLSGGRGVFRIPGSELERLRTPFATNHHIVP